jgi:hypothetical protein
MLIITGSGRSGTSAVARMVHEAGISVGHDLIPADQWNAEGYFEERPVIELNDAILNDCGLNKWFAEASREQILCAGRGRADAMRALVRNATPAWKDPRFSWTLEAWMELLPEKPRLIVCLRSPVEVIASTLRYYGQTSGGARKAVEHTWRCEYERLLDVIDDYRLDAAPVEFSRLHSFPAATARRLSRFVGVRLDPSFIRRDLRHHRSRVPARLRDLYARIRALGQRTPALTD